ncbi:MAG: Trp family transcriptional regulator [bacterium]
MASRWGLMKDLKSGMSQRKIAKKRKISLCKITRGSRILKNPESIANQLIEEVSR